MERRGRQPLPGQPIGCPRRPDVVGGLLQVPFAEQAPLGP